LAIKECGVVIVRVELMTGEYPEGVCKMGPNWGQQQQMRQQQQRQKQQMQQQQKQMRQQMERMREQQKKGYYWQQQKNKQQEQVKGKVPKLNLNPSLNKLNQPAKVQKKKGGCAGMLSFLVVLVFLAVVFLGLAIVWMNFK
jgi:hypothetical protein